MAKPNRVQRTSRNKATQASRDTHAKDSAKQPVDSSVAEDTENVETAEVEDADVEPATNADKGSEAGSTAVGAKDAEEKDDAKSETTSAKKETSSEKDSSSKTGKSESTKSNKAGKDEESSKETKSGKSESAKSSAKRTSRSGNPAKRASGRKTSTYSSADHGKVNRPNPRWFLPVMLGILLLGLVWLVVFYISTGKWPVEAWGNWNLLVGFGIMVVGLGMSTRWR